MQSALRSATRRAVGISISSRRGVATATTKAATATAREPERDWLAESEKAWVTALVQREVRAQMLADEERCIMRERYRLRTAVEEEEWPARRRRLLIPLWADYSLAALEGWVVGAGLAILPFGR